MSVQCIFTDNEKLKNSQVGGFTNTLKTINIYAPRHKSLFINAFAQSYLAFSKVMVVMLPCFTTSQIANLLIEVKQK